MNSTLSPADAQAFAKLRDLIDDIRVAMITTVGSDGALHSRPMMTLQTDADGLLWFFTADDSLKAHEIADEHQVNVSYAETSGQRYVSVSGTATVVKDQAKARELWTPMAKAYFPGGVDDPRLALLRVRIESAEYWDAPSSRMVRLYALARSIVTGDAPKQMGDHRQVDLPTFLSGK